MELGGFKRQKKRRTSIFFAAKKKNKHTNKKLMSDKDKTITNSITVGVNLINVIFCTPVLVAYVFVKIFVCLFKAIFFNLLVATYDILFNTVSQFGELWYVVSWRASRS